jgi:hypothetical protein
MPTGLSYAPSRSERPAEVEDRAVPAGVWPPAWSWPFSWPPSSGEACWAPRPGYRRRAGGYRRACRRRHEPQRPEGSGRAARDGRSGPGCGGGRPRWPLNALLGADVEIAIGTSRPVAPVGRCRHPTHLRTYPTRRMSACADHGGRLVQSRQSPSSVGPDARYRIRHRPHVRRLTHPDLRATPPSRRTCCTS